MGRAQLLLLALLALAALLQLLYRRLAWEPPREPGGPAPVPPRDRRAPPAPVPAARPELPAAPARVERPRAVAPPAPGPGAPGRIGSRRELRRAVVLMAVLGPCRGLEPAPLPARPAAGDAPPSLREP